MPAPATGFEIDPVYCDVIVARWERFSGQDGGAGRWLSPLRPRGATGRLTWRRSPVRCLGRGAEVPLRCDPRPRGHRVADTSAQAPGSPDTSEITVMGADRPRT